MYECKHMSWLAGTYESVESFERVQHDIFDAWPDIHEGSDGAWLDANCELVLTKIGDCND